MFNISFKFFLFTSILFLFSFSAKKKNKNIVFETFENGYGEWKVEGSAFKSSPFPASEFAANNVLSGYQGKFVVNSYNTRIEIDNPDKHTGTLTSPEFTINRNYISFLIAGGNHLGKAEIRLIVDGKKVAGVTGYNGKDMEEEFFETKKYLGKKAKLQIVDNHTGGWGFIAIDNIVFIDELGECEY